MADSSITKKALASALKELLATAPLSKISIGDICNRCEMNRKSFYYHFKDKEDLVNWIFDVEFHEHISGKEHMSSWDAIEALTYYFYENRSFYRKVLKYEGQNSFSEHLSRRFADLLSERLKDIPEPHEIKELQIMFISDGVICGLKRWLMSAECPPPRDFIGELKPCVYQMSKHICETIEREKDRY